MADDPWGNFPDALAQNPEETPVPYIRVLILIPDVSFLDFPRI